MWQECTNVIHFYVFLFYTHTSEWITEWSVIAYLIILNNQLILFVQSCVNVDSTQILYVCVGFQVPTGHCCASPAAMGRTRFSRSADHTALRMKTSCRGCLRWVRRQTDRFIFYPHYFSLFLDYFSTLLTVNLVNFFLTLSQFILF